MKRLLSIFAAAMIMSAFLGISVFETNHDDHHCTDENCPVCELISLAHQSRNQLLARPVSEPVPVKTDSFRIAFKQQFKANETAYCITKTARLNL